MRHLYGKAVGVPQPERGFARQRLAARIRRRADAVQRLSQQIVAVLKRLLKALFFQFQNRLDELAVVDKFGIRLAHSRYDGVGDFAQELALNADAPRVSDGAPRNPPQHIPAPLIARHDAVRYQECDAARMFRHHADGVCVVGIVVLSAADALNRRDNRREQIRLIRGIDALQYPRQPLKAHACVHAWRGQIGSRAVKMVVVLHEHQVPQLNVAVAHIAVSHFIGAVGSAVGSQAAVIRAVVVVQFAARPARALVARGPPPVLVVSETIHPIRGYAFCLPQPARLFVGFVNRRRELV